MSRNELPTRLLGPDGQVRDRIVGAEHELGLYYKPLDRNLPPGKDINPIFSSKVLRTTLDHNTEFMENGDRHYTDHSHPEIATGEDTSFNGMAIRLLLGYMDIAERFRQFAENGGLIEKQKIALAGINLIANTCSPHGTSYGKHVSLLARRGLTEEMFVLPLATHRATRIVWSGAGGVGNDGRRKYRPELSEKAPFIEEIANNETTHRRPLVNLRDEPLADEKLYRRIHNITGEGILNPFVLGLEAASDSIVLRALEAHVSFEDLYLDNPVLAMKQISSDITLKRLVELADGRKMTGLELQTAIAERAISGAIKEENITPQEIEWGERWLRLLNDLADDPLLCARRLNWCLKLRRIDRALAAERENGVSDLSVAWRESAQFQALLPGEHKGMQLLRRGDFEDSPSEEVWERGLPLPATRARVRGGIIRALRERGNEDYAPDWHRIHARTGGVALEMEDPYFSDLAAVDRFMELVDKPPTKLHSVRTLTLEELVA